MDPADFYTGLVAELYRPLRARPQVAGPYAQFIAEYGQPALELGCGDGEPLLELRRQGLDVEGLDSSADMLARCRQRAAAESLDVVLHHQRMEDFQVPRCFRSLFLAGPTFTLLPDDDTALRALRRIRQHLEPDGGTALIPLDVPEPLTPEQLGSSKEYREPGGALLRVSYLSQVRDEERRTQQITLRYERHDAHGRTVVERPWTLHWHTPDGFAALAEAAGLDVCDVRDVRDVRDGKQLEVAGAEFAFLLRPAADC